MDVTDTKQAIDWVHTWHLSEYHPIGSCAMGDALDTRLRVKGVKNLRVADASVFPGNVSRVVTVSLSRIEFADPLQVSGNIVSSVYATAEKAADLIKEDWDYAALNKAAS